MISGSFWGVIRIKKLIASLVSVLLAFTLSIICCSARSATFSVSSVSWQNSTAPSGGYTLNNSLITSSGYYVPAVNFTVDKVIAYKSNTATKTLYPILTFEGLDISGAVGFEFQYVSNSLTSSSEVVTGVPDSIVSQTSTKIIDDMSGQNWYSVTCSVHVENASNLDGLSIRLTCIQNTSIIDYNYLQIPMSSLTIYYDDTVNDYLSRIEAKQDTTNQLLTDISSKLTLSPEQQTKVDKLLDVNRDMATDVSKLENVLANISMPEVQYGDVVNNNPLIDGWNTANPGPASFFSFWDFLFTFGFSVCGFGVVLLSLIVVNKIVFHIGR